MHYTFKIPDIGEGTAEVEITAWRVNVGDVVDEDQAIADVMTDKATVELPAPVGGRIVELLGQPGERRPVGSPLVIIDAAEAGGKTEPPPAPSQPAPLQKVEAKPVEVASQPIREAKAEPDKVKPQARVRAVASPAVRALAWELGIELQFVSGSGPGGRITRQDLEAWQASHHDRATTSSHPPRRSQQTAVEEIKITGLRRRIAERMSEAKRNIPHFSYIEEVDVSALEELRAILNTGAAAKLTVLPFLARALCLALPKWPQINSRFDDGTGTLSRHAGVHLGIATQTPSGLLVPVLRHAESLSLKELSREILRLAGAARDGGLKQAELTGSTITITSLGKLGGLATTPVINRPEVAIVGVNRIVERPVVHRGTIVIRKMMNLSCSFDHRIVDGWDAAEFVQELRTLIEQHALLFAEGEL